MVSNKLKQIITINIVASFIFFFLYLIFLLSSLWDIRIYTIATLVTIPYIIFSIISYFKNEFFPILPFLLNLLIAILLSMGSNYIRLYVFLLAPVIIAMYYGSKKLNKYIIAFNILCFFGYLLVRSFVHKYPMPKFIITPIVSTLPYTLELFSIIWLAKTFIIDTEQIRKQNEIYSSFAKNNINMTIDIIKVFLTTKSQILELHSKNVMLYSSLIMNYLKNDEKYSNTITKDFYQYVQNGAYIHDLGRLNFDKQIAEKFSNFSEEDMEIIKNIPQNGLQILKSLPEGLISIKEKNVITNIILQCHDCFDGAGYSNKLLDQKVPLEAQIVSVAEVLDSKMIESESPETVSKVFNDAYMKLITTGYDKFNQDIVSIVYEHRLEIIDLFNNSYKEYKESLSNL